MTQDEVIHVMTAGVIYLMLTESVRFLDLSINFLFYMSGNHSSTFWTELWWRQTSHLVLTWFFVIALFHEVCVCHDGFVLLSNEALGCRSWSLLSSITVSVQWHQLLDTWWRKSGITTMNKIRWASWFKGYVLCCGKFLRGLIALKFRVNWQQLSWCFNILNWRNMYGNV